MSDYSTMRSRLENELKRADLSAEIAYAIQDAIRYYSDSHFFFNERELTISTSVGQEYYTLSGSFKEMLAVNVVHNQYRYNISAVPNNYIHRLSTSPTNTGFPRVFSIYNNQLRLYPVPNQASAGGSYAITLDFTSDLPSISFSASASITGTANSAWFTHGYELIRCRAKADVLENLIRGPEAVQEAQLLRGRETQALADLNVKTNRKRSSGQLTPWR